jgi:hypothetical protein
MPEAWGIASVEGISREEPRISKQTPYAELSCVLELSQS